ncbi:MAG: protein TolR [Alphaproteobacteria bacterium]|nr:protein TolR [Alphaproteobacteria bacterium]
MAGGVNGSSGIRGRGAWRARLRPNSQINVTPFVDVMLVLLVIFMVTAPLLTVGVPVNLPQTRARQMSDDKEPIAITIKKNGDIFLQETQIQLDELVPKLTAIAQNGYDERIYVRGDKTVDYGTVMEVMGELNAAGFKRIGLVTDSKRERKQN